MGLAVRHRGGAALIPIQGGAAPSARPRAHSIDGSEPSTASKMSIRCPYEQTPIASFSTDSVSLSNRLPLMLLDLKVSSYKLQSLGSVATQAATSASLQREGSRLRPVPSVADARLPPLW